MTGALELGAAMRQQKCQCGETFEQKAIIVDGRPTLWHPHRCAACQLEREAEYQRGKREREHRRPDTLGQLDVPPKYADATLRTFQLHGEPKNQQTQGRVLQIMRRYITLWPKVDALLVFRGPPGTGKGHVVWSLAKAIAESHAAAVTVVKCADLVRHIRASWRDPEAATEEAVVAHYRQADFLVIDEVSRHAFYGQQIHQHLYDVIDHRIEYGRPTILTTNEDDAGIQEILRPALVDRLEGEGGMLDFGDESWRSRPRETV